METKTDYIVTPDSITIPRPEDIKITKKNPTVEKLQELKAAWLKEAEDNGMINDLFLIVETYGVIPEKQVHRGWQPLRRFEFADGESDYVILLERTVWGIGTGTMIPWKHIYVVENGEHMREIEYGNKRLVNYFKRLELAPNETIIPESDQVKIEKNFYVPGSWEGMIGVFAKDARYQISDAKKEKADNVRKDLLMDLFHGQEV